MKSSSISPPHPSPPLSSLPTLGGKMSLLRRMAHRDDLDEDAMVLPIDRTGHRDSSLRQQYNATIDRTRYGRGRLQHGTTFPFYLSSSSDDDDDEDDEEEDARAPPTPGVGAANREDDADTLRLTRGMARSRTLRKRESREARDWSGLEALVEAAQEVLVVTDVPPRPPSTPLVAFLPKARSKGSSRKRHRVVEGSATNNKEVRVVRIVVDQATFRYKRDSNSSSGASKQQQQQVIMSSSKKKKKQDKAKKKKTFPKSTTITSSSVPDRASLSPTLVSSSTSFKLSTPSRVSISPGIADKKTSSNIHVDPYSKALYAKLDTTSGRQPVSLSLLDWRRRRQWVPSTPNTAEEDATLDNRNNNSISNITMVHAKLSDVPKRPRMLEVPRKGHDRRLYAEWCCKLVRCLSGSGRSNAMYEWFYSDMDRAWFTFDSYKVQMAAMGVPTNAKLTRTEWGLLRRRIRKRPRKFSPAFIKSQLADLQRYRDNVRHVRYHKNIDAVPRFRYEVPPPVPIGSVVTAYNKRARVLHRGIVLTEDPYRRRYMVQFERKELGCEFCPDHEVAGHGVAPHLKAPDPIAVDGSLMGGGRLAVDTMGSLPIGTSYGPLIDRHKERNHEAVERANYVTDQNTRQQQQQQKQQQGVARALYSELAEASNDDTVTTTTNEDEDYESEPMAVPSSTNISSVVDNNNISYNSTAPSPIRLLPRRTSTSSNTNHHGNTNNNSRDHNPPLLSPNTDGTVNMCGEVEYNNSIIVNDPEMMDVMAERECLVKLMGMLHAMTERKTLILDAMDAYYDVVDEAASSKDRVSDDGYFKEHYAWLHANLQTTNESLSAAIVHLQVMYGKSYACRPSFDPPSDWAGGKLPSSVKNSDHNMQSYSNNVDFLNTNSNSWLQNITSQCLDIGAAVSSRSSQTTDATSDRSGSRHNNIKNNNNNNTHSQTYLDSRFASATSLLLCTQLFKDHYSSTSTDDDDDESSRGCDEPTEPSPSKRDRSLLDRRFVQEALAKSLTRLEIPATVPWHPHNSEIDTARAKGFLDLREALQIFQAELMAN